MSERADAAHNRQRVLTAAAALFARKDPRVVTMDELAREAGVGRATLYRRYPTISAVAVALLDDHERQLQEDLISGPPPLGPGAPPARRLAAFYGRMVDLLEHHGRLVLGAEVGNARFSTGAYGFWRAHVLALAREAGAADAEALADALLAPVAPDVYLHQRENGLDVERITAALGVLAQVLDAAESGAAGADDQ
ncbi:transcriptional regulator [Saccharomonospora sp. CUA-673]|uniref:TetR/AcrR family transcriptional regulator n=1 Tax=Saccharomonospora sp. CUA-673 TaxID=1904969 RepID=UPI000962BAF7|nr:TetR/AcrR family transcriptional regulator [Saccharomonospora sp. CUA-673]OLT43113.1 transcriptional regulator [Saccharomonospora sp. CUA-673]